MSAFTSAFESLVGPTRAPNAARVSSRRATRGASTVAAAADSKSAGKGEQAERARMNIAFPTEEQAEMMEKLGFDKPGQEDTIPLVADTFKWDEDRPFHRCAPPLGAPVHDFPFPPPAPTADVENKLNPRPDARTPRRYRDLEHFKHDLSRIQYGGKDGVDDRKPGANPRSLPSPITYRVTVPDDYDGDRDVPYPMVVAVPADAGFGQTLNATGATKVICDDEKFHDKNECVVVELGFNRPTWLADTVASNHESFFLDVILPRVLARYNVGTISLIGYANGGFGALNMLLRHPHLFHRVAVADVPVLGDFTGYMRPWGHVDFGDQSDDDGKPPWASFAHAFPHNAMFLPYNAGALATCEYVSGEMGFSASGEARIGMWSGAKTRWEMEQLAEQFEEFDVPHRFSTEFDDENADWNGEWLKDALAFLAADM